MSNVEQIIERFGGLSAMARKLGHKHPSRVQGWRDRGVIPARQQRAVLEAAEANGIPLTPTELLPPQAA